MGYSVVRGGERAMREAERLIDAFRKGLVHPERDDLSAPQPEAIEGGLRFAVYKVMSEAGIYAPRLAAFAIQQAEGDLMEAAFLLRAFRACLPRWGTTLPADTAEMRAIRRISAAFKEVPGGQFLGPTRDYTVRLLKEALQSGSDQQAGSVELAAQPDLQELPGAMPKVADVLRRCGLVAPLPDSSENAPVHDITMRPMRFPRPARSARLQALARGETGALTALAYSSLRGYGHVHPTIAELRVGFVPVRVIHPELGEEVSIGEILLTECESIATGVGMISSNNTECGPQFELGYGASFGQNETKAIAMSVLDANLSQPEAKGPADDQEFVLYHIDGVESSGFVDHLKLPHYMLFTSILDRVNAAAEAQAAAKSGNSPASGADTATSAKVHSMGSVVSKEVGS